MYVNACQFKMLPFGSDQHHVPFINIGNALNLNKNISNIWKWVKAS